MARSTEYWSQSKGVKLLKDLCVSCGNYVPEGRQVCPTCEVDLLINTEELGDIC